MTQVQDYPPSEQRDRDRGPSDPSPLDPLVSDGFTVPDLGANEDAPPAYGDVHDQLHLSQSGFEAGAAVTNDGRVNINIREKNRRLADLLAPTLRNQLATAQEAPQPDLPPAHIPPSLGGQPGQNPPPHMNVVVQIVGSRGDVQPFVALGKVLRETYGHRVRIATHTTFQKFVEDNGLEFFNIGGDPAELMAFMVKNPGLMPGFDALRTGEVQKRRRGIEEILMGCWRSCIETGNGLGPPLPPHPRSKEQRPGEGPILDYGYDSEKPFVADAIIANPPSFAHIHIAEKLGIPLHMMFTMPWSPTRAFPHPLANIQSSNTDVTMTNYTSYALVEMMTWQGLGDVINRFRTKALDLEPLSLMWAPGLLTRLRIPYTYCWSPALIPKPNDWAKNISISGFYFLNLASSYNPPPDLAAYLASGPPPVYIGFGSIVVDDPNALTRTIFDAVSIAGVRALVSQGWGGLGADSVGIPDGVYMLGNCPHDWLFQHVSAVVHHGGAGTTAAGIKAGVPTVVVPFFGDQPFWGSMIQRAGAGPAPIPNKELNAENLAAAIQECLRPETQARAKELGAQIREEQGCEVGGMHFHEQLEVDNLRCTLAPRRIAVWRVRRTKVRLSALTAAVLAREGLIKFSDLKLYRPKEYDTEEQPWDPISAVTASLLADIGSITMGIAEMPWGVYKAASQKAEMVSNSSGSQIAGSAKWDAASVTTASTVAGPSGRRDTESIVELPAISPSVTVTPSEPGPLTSHPVNLGGHGSPTPQSPQPLHERARSMSSSKSRNRLRAASGSPSPRPECNQFTMDNMVQTGRGMGRIVETGLKSPMNFCMGLAKGFRNVPRLYNDETVRPAEKVTDLQSGLKVAGKEFGLGFYDGLSGLVTQPVKGAQKGGAAGLVKGMGKGLGGLVLKPAAAIWALPAYTLQGVHAEVRNKTAKSMQNYILAARMKQGEDDLARSTPEECADIVRRWEDMAHKESLQPFYLLKGREIAIKSKERQAVERGKDPGKSWITRSKTSLGAHVQQQTEQWVQRRGGHQPGLLNRASTSTGQWSGSSYSLAPTVTTSSSGSANTATRTSEDEEFERAIQVSVRETSRGNADEDAMIEQAIRASVQEMRMQLKYQHSPDYQQQYAQAQSNLSSPAVPITHQTQQLWSQQTPQGPNTPTTGPVQAQGITSSSTEQVMVPSATTFELPGSIPSFLPDQSPHHQRRQAPDDFGALTVQDMQITDEEYQSLIEQAIQQSLVEQQAALLSSGVRRHSGDDSDYSDEDPRRAIEKSSTPTSLANVKGKAVAPLHDHEPGSGAGAAEEDADFKRAIEESQAGPSTRPKTREEDEEEEMLRRAIEESKAEVTAEMREEEIVLEYVKRQSLAEEAYRKRVGKMKVMAVPEDEDEDEDLRRALEESLKVSSSPQRYRDGKEGGEWGEGPSEEGTVEGQKK